MDTKEEQNRCSFCGKEEEQATLLISGLYGNICNDCALQAYTIAQEVSQESKSSEFSLGENAIHKPKEIAAYLRRVRKAKSWDV